MAFYIKYRGNKHVPVTKVGGVIKSGKHKGYVKLKTKERVGKRPKGSIDYRKPENLYKDKSS